MPLMGKKAQTSQDMFKARKQREEEEKDALLPPGLINHGNTCFMNSVLQGLIATPMLADIVRFSLSPTYLPISSRRSPQLTNGHGRGGQWEQEWERGMPLGDVFVNLMEKGWRLQDDRVRASLSPKEILTRLGTKYDQYLDFRQQDAHELLRHLLDAMRMEEWDLIKKRQPPPPKNKRKKGRRVSRADSATLVSVGTTDSIVSTPPSKSIPEEDRLTSFVDMVFGGKLASILVCEKCKKVSCTYEDFNDLSLSIKPEDYEKVRKRDRLKNLAKKLTIRSGREGGPRASSVPASPTRKSVDMDKVFEHVSVPDPRRRSLENVDGKAGLLDESDGATAELDIQAGSSGGAEPVQRIDREAPKEAKNNRLQPPGADDEVGELSKDKDSDDGWVKLGRRISLGMGINMPKSRGKPRPRSVGVKEKDTDRSRGQGASTTGTATPAEQPEDVILDIKAPTPTAPQGVTIANVGFQTPVQSQMPTLASPASSRSPSPSARLPLLQRSSSPSIPRAKSPRPPKPTREEAAYLRRLLADIPSSSSNPFAIFNTLSPAAESPSSSSTNGNSNFSPSSGGGVGTFNNLWSKLGNVQSVEECLRMFTAVEALDGENMVGCRRCWKIENGTYRPRGRSIEVVGKIGLEDVEAEADGSSDSEGEERGREPMVSLPPSLDLKSLASSSPPLPPLPLNESSSPTPTSIPLPSTTPTSELHEAQGDSPVASQEAVADVPTTLTAKTPPTPLEPLMTYGGFLIPSISTTAPESPHSSISTADTITPVTPDDYTPVALTYGTNGTSVTLMRDLTPPLGTSPSKDSLTLPTLRRPVRRSTTERRSSVLALTANGIQSTPTSDESSDEFESDDGSTSVYSSTSSATSSSALPAPNTVPYSEPLTTPIQASPTQPPITGYSPGTTTQIVTSPSIPRSKQVIPRRSYKRYLLATPPPILVIHLKRFQQVGKPPSMASPSFFANFRKLDDFVAVPEVLDLKPFLLPRREDFGLRTGKMTGKEGGNGKREADDRCMYRLYAVVVHIGNMLGGHYVAYTALPTPSSALPPPKGDKSPIHPPPRTQSCDRKAEPHRQWCYISDTVVRLTTLEEVLKAKAYICMYERITTS